ncbi:MAG: PaaI family thioesterase [Prolixibacteraceae bacterium]|nr:PaaI family thioesterase [Prolixibacteraceae bacterium]
MICDRAGITDLPSFQVTGIMRKIVNPFSPVAGVGEYNCFGCSPANDKGLHLEFWEDGDEIIAKWQPRKEFEGWTGVLHGGIQATLLDEAAAWLVFIKLKTAGVTAQLSVEYPKPAFISKGEFTVKAILVSFQKNIAKIRSILYDGDGHICATSDAEYFCFPEKIARAKYNYPGVEAFYAE